MVNYLFYFFYFFILIQFRLLCSYPVAYLSVLEAMVLSA